MNEGEQETHGRRDKCRQVYIFGNIVEGGESEIILNTEGRKKYLRKKQKKGMEKKMKLPVEQEEK